LQLFIYVVLPNLQPFWVNTCVAKIVFFLQTNNELLESFCQRLF
jgi:hypothetical protein